MTNNPNILNKKRILVIGDIMLDVYVDNDVKRISPEAPVPVLDFRSARAMAGAAANVARNIISLGSEATLISIVGNDSQGRDLIKFIGKISNLVPYIKIAKDRITTVKTRYTCQNHQMFRMDRERAYPIEDSLAGEIYHIIRSEASNHDAILISDYAKGLLSDKLVLEMMTLFQTLQIPVIVDSKNKNYRIYNGATLATPNTSELYQATNIESIEDAAYALMDSYHIENILVTQGAHGMTLVGNIGDPIHIHAETDGVIDVTGAGDTVAAVMAIGLANGCDLVDCMKIANKAAAIVVRKPGVATVTKGELSWKPILH